MWAELQIETKRDLPAQLGHTLAAYFNRSSPVLAALRATRWGQNYQPGDEDDVVYANSDPLRVFLVYQEGPQSLRVHIENYLNKNKLETLKRSAERISEQFCGFVKRNKGGIRGLSIVVWVEDNDYLHGARTSLLHRLGRSLTDNLWTKTYVPIATFLASIALHNDVKKAGFNVAAAVLAMLLWVLVDAAFGGKAYHYHEV